ncbi:MAG: imelysin family protein [Halomonas sp.]|nr:imelysin family protein [Halomonas sp.]MDN6297416.1 imelysin family protein [Halomonas sp.]MDN6314693.1 imelysin family protein [Halomonas sp.]MDN6336308.1 imelysin family protein [Halomonas sp.]
MAHTRSLYRAGMITTALLMTAGTATAADQPTPRQQWHQAAAQQYSALADAAETLEQSAADYCANAKNQPSDDARATLEHDWLAAYQRWQAVRYVQFGPVEQQSRGWQLQFWPDSKNLVGRKVGLALKADTPATLDDVEQAGVALQGFPALEYLLYDDAMDDASLANPGACALAQNISTHIRQTTQALEDDWQAFGEHFESTDGYTHTLLQSAVQSVEQLEEKRLAAPLGLAGTPANSYRAEAWRSGESVALMRASLEGLREGVMPGLTALLHSRGHPALVDKLEAQLDEVIARANTLPDGMVRAIEAPTIEGEGPEQKAAFADLQGFYVQVSQLRRLLASDVAAATGLRRGFNSSDGD